MSAWRGASDGASDRFNRTRNGCVRCVRSFQDHSVRPWGDLRIIGRIGREACLDTQGASDASDNQNYQQRGEKGHGTVTAASDASDRFKITPRAYAPEGADTEESDASDASDAAPRDGHARPK